ncbi:hypothetical protein FBQ85_00540 [Cytophagia bacterium CHB2]|nr:hypothetical protein [Cytophagia bacterium CHB2]
MPEKTRIDKLVQPKLHYPPSNSNSSWKLTGVTDDAFILSPLFEMQANRAHKLKVSGIFWKEGAAPA